MRSRVLGLGLAVLALAQIAAGAAHVAALKGIAAATGASPAPKVFSTVRGLETFSSRFLLRWRSGDGEHALALTPELYARLRGPYNRRNVYGAALAFGPVLAADPRTRPMLEDVLRYALAGDAPLLRELGVADALPGSVSVEVLPGAGRPDPSLPLVLR
jgi:hypothetical protein